MPWDVVLKPYYCHSAKKILLVPRPLPKKQERVRYALCAHARNYVSTRLRQVQALCNTDTGGRKVRAPNFGRVLLPNVCNFIEESTRIH